MGRRRGTEAARAWASAMFLNFDAVVDMGKDENVGLTKVVSSDRLCADPICDAFTAITIE